MLVCHSLPDSATLMIVGVESFHMGVPSGLLYSCFVKTGIPFCGLMDLFQSVNRILDSLRHPQRQFEPRRVFAEKPRGRAPQNRVWTMPVPPTEPCWKLEELKAAASSAKELFVVRVVFRQSASLQGWMEWPQGKRRIPYRSALELGEMMLEILERSELSERAVL